MAHELTIRQNGTVEMAFAAGVDRWHGLGNELRAGATIEEWIAAAGMNWKVVSGDALYRFGDDILTVPNKKVLFRSDTASPLGVVSDEYRPVHPQEVLEFFRDLTADAGFELRTAGTLFGGQKLWALAHIGQDAIIRDRHDVVGGYLLLVTGTNGHVTTEGRFTTVCVVCNNTLEMARGGKKAEVKVPHSTTFHPGQMKKALGVGRDRFAETIEQFRALASYPIAPVQSLELTAELFAPGFSEMDQPAKDKVLKSKAVTRVGELTIGRQGIANDLDGRDGTAWGWVNGITQYVDHEARAKSADHRMDNAWFRRGSEIKERALEMAVQTVNGATHYTPVSSTVSAGSASILDDVLAASA